MPAARSGLLSGFLLLAALCTASAGNVLFIITPGPQSHMYGMRKIALEVASRQHNVLVGLIAMLSATIAHHIVLLSLCQSLLEHQGEALRPLNTRLVHCTSEQLIDQLPGQHKCTE